MPESPRHASGYLEKYSWINLAKRFLIDSELIGPYEGHWLRVNHHYVNGPAFGGLIGSARGFGVFLQDQLAPRSRLLDDETRALFFEPQCTQHGTAVPMTLGWYLGDLVGRRFFYKEGGGGGFHCMMRMYRSRGIASVMMTNATVFDINRCMNRIDRAFLR